MCVYPTTSFIYLPPNRMDMWGFVYIHGCVFDGPVFILIDVCVCVCMEVYRKINYRLIYVHKLYIIYYHSEVLLSIHLLSLSLSHSLSLYMLVCVCVCARTRVTFNKLYKF